MIYGSIKPKQKTGIEKNMCIYFDQINQVIEKYQPINISIESQYIGKNPASGIKISIIKGIIVLASSKKNIPIYEYTPTQAKKSVTGNGKSDKEGVKKMIKLLLKQKTPLPEDPSDAAALAICHFHSNNKLISTMV